MDCINTKTQRYSDAEWTIPFTELFAYMNENMDSEMKKRTIHTSCGC